MLSTTAIKAINAYGGTELWQNHKFIEAEVSASGLAFTLKRRPIFNHAIIKMEIDKPFSKITPIGNKRNISGILDQHNVRTEDENGKLLSERKNARIFFPYGRRLFYWDDLDMAYFANYAFWNYFTLPKLLMNNQINWTEKSEGKLQAIFPESIPTHSQVQEFKFDLKNGLLLQHNYTADIISKLATAANKVIEHTQSETLVYPSYRLVTPRNKSGNALKRPVLIDIKVHKFKLSNEW